MHSFLNAMAADMGINRYHGETNELFIYRVCYSALGQWCLHIARNSSNGIEGTTKHNQTIILNELIERFLELFPSLNERFVNSSTHLITFPVFIRNIYEETGYLMTDNDNHNRIANYGRSIMFGNKSLFFGIPDTDYIVNGLGIFADDTNYKVVSKEYLIRDKLTCEEYFESRFNSIDFYDRDIDTEELEFFNPHSNRVPSKSWEKQLVTEFTVARKTEFGPFYRVMRVADKIQYADEPVEQQDDSLTSYEYRRLYFALKAHYGNPLRAIVTKYDEMYSKISFRGHLPNREYYFLLLLSWPEHDAFDKVNFIIKNDLLSEVINVLTNIGIVIRGGHANG